MCVAKTYKFYWKVRNFDPWEGVARRKGKLDTPPKDSTTSGLVQRVLLASCIQQFVKSHTRYAYESRRDFLAKDFEKAYKNVVKKNEQDFEFYK